MAKIKYVVKELNEPSALALVNLNQKVYNILLDSSDNKDADITQESTDGLKTA